MGKIIHPTKTAAEAGGRALARGRFLILLLCQIVILFDDRKNLGYLCDFC